MTQNLADELLQSSGQRMKIHEPVAESKRESKKHRETEGEGKDRKGERKLFGHINEPQQILAEIFKDITFTLNAKKKLCRAPVCPKERKYDFLFIKNFFLNKRL